MSRLATAFVLGYHGCDRSIGERVVAGEVRLLHSKRDYDWLGPGAYFWESDPLRALEWAQSRASERKIETPFVVGAVIDLRNCLDLLNREDLEILRGAHASFMKMQQKAGLEVPENRSAGGRADADRVLRFLDCAVIKHLHSILDQRSEGSGRLEPYDTVRGFFTEGGSLYEGSGFRRKSHVQIAVRNDACIRGLFVPRPYPGDETARADGQTGAL